MTLAVLYASPGDALDPADASRLAGELAAAMRAAGTAEPVHVDVTQSDAADRIRAVAAQARAAGEPVLIAAADLVAHPSLLWMLVTEPAGRTTALTVPAEGGELRNDRGRLLLATDGDGNTSYAGAICIAPADLPLLEKAASILAAAPFAATGSVPPSTVPASTVPASTTSAGAAATDFVVAEGADALFGGLLAAGLVPLATPVRLLHAERVRDGAGLARAEAAVAAVDEDRARLRMAVKEKDDFFTTYAVSTWSPVVTKLSARLKLSPSAVTGFSVLFAVGAALAFWQASRVALIAGAVLLYLGFVLDCVDGQLARYTRTFGAFGGWLDTMADRAKEYAAYAGLAAGAERMGLPYAWPLAITAITLQTVRHMTDTWYGALHDEAAARPRPQATGGVGARLTAASNKVQGDTGSAAYWLKRIVVFPIGERWALIAVLAALTNGRVALIAVVGWGVLAAGYTLALRSLRSLSMKVGVLDTVDTRRHRDDGVLFSGVLNKAPLGFAVLGAFGALAAVVALLAGWVDRPAKVVVAVAALLVLAAGLPAGARHGGPLDWLVPAFLRAGEYLLVSGVGLSGSVPPSVVFLLLFVLALRHYDLTARMEKGAPAGSSRRDPLGFEGRVVVLAVAALTGLATPGEVLLAVLVGGSFLFNAIADWRAGGTRA